MKSDKDKFFQIWNRRESAYCSDHTGQVLRFSEKAATQFNNDQDTPEFFQVHEFTGEAAQMFVVLESQINPDHSHSSNRMIATALVPVLSVEEAKKKVLTFITDSGIGGGNWTGGQVIKGEKQIARIMYNGRIDYDERPF